MLWRIRNFFREARAIKFILGHSDIVSNVSKDRSFEDAAMEAVNSYIDENYKLLPRRYKLILEELNSLGLISDEALGPYVASKRNTLLGGRTIEFTEHEDGTTTQFEIPVQNFPWEDDPQIMNRVTDRLKQRIEELLADARIARKNERGFADTLVMLIARAERVEEE